MTVDSDCVARALKIVENAGSDDIFRPPFFCDPIEFDYLHNEVLRNRLRSEAEKFLRNPKIKGINRLTRFAIPKNPYAYRNASFIDIEDLIKYLCLVLKAGDKIEDCRIPRSKNVVFSYRYNKKGSLFSEKFNFKAFRI